LERYLRVQDMSTPTTPPMPQPNAYEPQHERPTTARNRIRHLRTLVVVLVGLGGAIGLAPPPGEVPEAASPGYGRAQAQRASVTTTPDTARRPGRAARAASASEPGRAVGTGEASYYGDELRGRPTASGEAFDPAAYTAAHRTLPLGTRLRVTNLDNGRSVVVRVNDRGPFSGDRVLDVSERAAHDLGMLGRGTARVRMELIIS